MTTEARPEPSDYSSKDVVGEELEESLLDAGVKPPQARALRAAVELVVLRLRASVATKGDLAEVKSDLRQEIARIEKDLRQEIAQTKADLQQEIAQTKADLQQEIAQTKAELRQEIAQTKAELRQEIAQTRADLRQEIAQAKADLQRQIDDLRREMRWGMFLMMTVLGGMMIALLTRTF